MTKRKTESAARTQADMDRKATASYYTPPELVDCCLDTALDPILDEFSKRPSLDGDPAGAFFHPVTGLKFLDPCCGAAVFSVRACRRIARRVAQLRLGLTATEPRPEGDWRQTQLWPQDPPEDAYRRALWQVVDQCCHGVDLNPYAVELAKVVLWMESAYEGAGCQFLEPNIQHGNALLGADPKVMAGGVPDEAWEAITGDDKAVARELKKRNREERKCSS